MSIALTIWRQTAELVQRRLRKSHASESLRRSQPVLVSLACLTYEPSLPASMLTSALLPISLAIGTSRPAVHRTLVPTMAAPNAAPVYDGQYAAELRATAQAMTAKGKGLLACDESTGTIGTRLEANGMENTEEWRQKSARSRLEGRKEEAPGPTC